jgi:predicted glycoside hydrolase/deacetylase ChbG (UPF0249 family)
MKMLIVNADDFGFTRGVNSGIVRAFCEGILTSTTIMANGEAFDHAVQLARENPQLALGCHLAAVGGRPLSKVDSPLVDEQGLLPATLTQLLMKIATGKVRTSDIEREFVAQVERTVAAGIKPTHLDTHKHTAVHPAVMLALVRTAKAFAIPGLRFPFERAASGLRAAPGSGRRAYWKQRLVAQATRLSARRFKSLAETHGLRTPDNFCGVALTGLLDGEALITIIRSLGDGATELMCHPGLYDEDLERAPTRLKRQRQMELEALLDPGVRQWLTAENVTLVSYAQLSSRA